MKIVFLDFDGVIRLPVFGTIPPEAEFSPPHLGRLQQLIQKTHAQIVVSSDWRLRMERAEILSVLGREFPDSSLHPDWRTPDLSATHGKIPRQLEIRSWLESHPDVETFVILDDLTRSQFGDLAHRLVRCTFLDGLTESLLQEALGKML